MISRIFGFLEGLPARLLAPVVVICIVLGLVLSLVVLSWGVSPRAIFGFWGLVLVVLVLSEVPKLLHNHVVELVVLIFLAIGGGFIFIRFADGNAPPAHKDCISSLSRIGLTDKNTVEILGIGWADSVAAVASRLQGCESTETPFVFAKLLGANYSLPGCNSGSCPEAIKLYNVLVAPIEGIDLWGFEQSLNDIAASAEIQAQSRLLLTTSTTVEILLSYSILVVAVWLLSEGFWFLPTGHWGWSAIVSVGLFISAIVATHIVISLRICVS